MTCFGELFALYPGQMMMLCIEECAHAERLFCWINWPLENEPCELCKRHYFDDGTCDPHTRNVCDDAECRRLWQWLWVSRADGGYKRRGAIKRLFGKDIWSIPRGMRREAILAAMLLIESQEKANGTRLRVAA